MKYPLLPVVLGTLLPLVMCSCETTGDPRQGGLFGWSESQAQGRIYQREAELSAIERDTARQRSRSRYLEGRLDQAERDAARMR
jgi:hypothetical protein